MILDGVNTITELNQSDDSLAFQASSKIESLSGSGTLQFSDVDNVTLGGTIAFSATVIVGDNDGVAVGPGLAGTGKIVVQEAEDIIPFVSDVANSFAGTIQLEAGIICRRLIPPWARPIFSCPARARQMRYTFPRRGASPTLPNPVTVQGRLQLGTPGSSSAGPKLKFTNNVPPGQLLRAGRILFPYRSDYCLRDRGNA